MGQRVILTLIVISLINTVINIVVYLHQLKRYLIDGLIAIMAVSASI